ncbi:nuclease domain-containing protein [Serratia marcescens]|uniref:nuclease domain-containing protein n=1 Tax=Serratia marcescens TaxID=615 RepID=UPI001F5C07BA|nr:nuclease domain-containing protein [Serratia marcescens]
MRDSAQGQCCTLQISGICNGNQETTVLCHLPSSTHGIGYKSDDYWVVFGCPSCHDVIDGRIPYDWRPGELEETYRHAINHTLRMWFDMEMILIKGSLK